MLPSPLVTVELAFGYMLEHPCIPRYQLLLERESER
jgi:hypothetical protein